MELEWNASPRGKPCDCCENVSQVFVAHQNLPLRLFKHKMSAN